MFYIIKDAKGVELGRQNDKDEAIKFAQANPGSAVTDSIEGKTVEVPAVEVAPAVPVVETPKTETPA